jgi:hypothetical protein
MEILLFNRRNKLRQETLPENPEAEKFIVVGKTLRVQDVLNFFTHDANPAYFDAKLEAELAKMQTGMRNVPWGWIIACIAIIIAGVVAYSILNPTLQYNSLLEQARNLVGGTTTATTTAAKILTT